MERRAMLALVLVGLGGCKQLLGFDDPTIAPDAEPATDDGYLSGTRLKLVWNDYAGTRQFVSVYDTELAETCDASLWADGATYCLPRSGAVGYADAACTQPIGLGSHPNACVSQQRYFSVFEAMPCSGTRRTKLFRSEGPQTPQQFYRRNAITGACDGPQISSFYEQFRLGAEVTMAELVELTPTTQTMGRLEQRGFLGSDGARFPSSIDGIHDTTLDTACTISPTGSCTLTGAQPGPFGDASCSQALGAQVTACGTPKYGARARRPGCPDTLLDFFALGSAFVAAPSLYQLDSTNACIAYPPTQGYSYFSQGGLVVPATLARSVDTEPGRQIQRVYFTDAMAKIRGSQLFDTLHGTECATYGGRCLPSGAWVQTYFTSGMCNVAADVTIVSSGPASCGLPSPPRYAIKATATANGCDSTYQVFTVGTKHTGMLYLRSADGLTCSAVTLQNSVVYDVLKEIDPSELATATVITDP